MDLIVFIKLLYCLPGSLSIMMKSSDAALEAGVVISGCSQSRLGVN